MDRYSNTNPLANFLDVLGDTGWQEKAACKDSPDPTMFDLEDPRNSEAIDSYCTFCPVRNECLTYARDNKLWGSIWGGSTELDKDPRHEPGWATDYCNKGHDKTGDNKLVDRAGRVFCKQCYEGPKSFRRLSHCKRGHDLNDPNNVSISPGRGQRSCKECSRTRQTARNARLKAERGRLR